MPIKVPQLPTFRISELVPKESSVCHAFRELLQLLAREMIPTSAMESPFRLHEQATLESATVELQVVRAPAKVKTRLHEQQTKIAAGPCLFSQALLSYTRHKSSTDPG
jgi:hypothetical protein